MDRAESGVAWHAMWTEILAYAYLGLPACLMTIDPQSWSVMREFSDAPVKEIDGHKYLVVYENQCTKSLLQSVSESEDFKRGLLLLASEFSDQLTRIHATIPTPNGIPNLPANCKDVLLCVADATVLWWVNPSCSKSELTSFLANLTHVQGFRFEIQGETRAAEDSS